MSKLDLVAIGNAIVDMIAPISDEGLAALGVQKGIMQLVGDDEAMKLYAGMKNPVQTAGGSAANTAVVASILGASAQYISKTADDEIGIFFAESMKDEGVIYTTPRCNDHASGRSMIFVTPDGERSMNTYLGASEYLHMDDIDFEAIANSRYLYLEGYRFDGPDSQAAFKLAVKTCKENDGIATITLSDPFCVGRHHDAFRDLIEGGIDIVFCNEHELVAYTEAADFIAACEAVRHSGTDFICTAGAAGAYVISRGEIIHVPTKSVTVKDATGAGDYFAGGFLASIARGDDYVKAADIGCKIAGEVVQIVGTRVTSDLKALMD